MSQILVGYADIKWYFNRNLTPVTTERPDGILGRDLAAREICAQFNVRQE